VDPNPVGGAPAGTKAADELNVPAILLIVCGALGALSALGGLFGSGALMQVLAKNPQFSDLAAKMAQNQSGAMHYVSPLLSVILSGVIIFGALKMRALENYNLALASAIVALLPCGGCCCLPLPVGIWALVLLMKPEIKSQFRG
jgi:hypothetical protein